MADIDADGDVDIVVVASASGTISVRTLSTKRTDELAVMLESVVGMLVLARTIDRSAEADGHIAWDDSERLGHGELSPGAALLRPPRVEIEQQDTVEGATAGGFGQNQATIEGRLATCTVATR